MFLRILFFVLTGLSVLAFGVTGEWYWITLAVATGTGAYLFGDDDDDA